jgi:hypothetical protein
LNGLRHSKTQVGQLNWAPRNYRGNLNLRLYNNDKKSDAMRTINVAALIDGARFNAFHARVLFWCALIIIFDGYDLVIYGVVLPSLMAEWGLSSLQAGALGSCALVGMMLGALFFGSLSKNHHDVRHAFQWRYCDQRLGAEPGGFCVMSIYRRFGDRWSNAERCCADERVCAQEVS